VEGGGGAVSVFERHLDLAPLRSRRRGLVFCIFHDDRRRPSLSVDLERGLFNCFACGAQGGIRRFAELVGETVAAPKCRPESPWQEAMRRAAQTARRQAERMAGWEDWNRCADFIRWSVRLVDQVRRDITTLGLDHPRTWPALERAARVELQARRIDAELDAILSSGRVA